MAERVSVRAREILAGRLRERSTEVSQSILCRVQDLGGSAVDISGSGRDLIATVAATVDYGLETIESGEEQVCSIPAAPLVEARRAARSGLPVETLLRRYVAGHGLLAEFVIEEATAAGLTQESLKHVVRDLAMVFDRLLEAVSEEFMRAIAKPISSKERQAARVRRLLAGEPLDASTLAYEFEGVHVGIVAEGPQAAERVQEVSNFIDCRTLVVSPSTNRAWGWVAHRRNIEARAVHEALEKCATELAVAIGEPMRGLSGWRLSHEQAKAALPIGIHRKTTVRYVEVALLASLVQDNLLSISLRKLYLAPLASTADGGIKLRQTLRAYIDAQRNVSSTAAALGVSRRTVSNRLRMAERTLGRPLDPELPALEAALALEAFQSES